MSLAPIRRPSAASESFRQIHRADHLLVPRNGVAVGHASDEVGDVAGTLGLRLG